jgi:hypothetical protein
MMFTPVRSGEEQLRMELARIWSAFKEVFSRRRQ